MTGDLAPLRGGFENGRSARQRSVAWPQRVWKWQPSGDLSADDHDHAPGSLLRHTRVRRPKSPLRFQVRTMSRVAKRSASQALKSGLSHRGQKPSDSPLPRFISPQLSQPVAKPPSGPQWLHEIKLDGFRRRCHVIETTTRSGIAVRNFNWPRRPRATWSSPQREARGAIELI
jgi:hypothetical protein